MSSRRARTLCGGCSRRAVAAGNARTPLAGGTQNPSCSTSAPRARTELVPPTAFLSLGLAFGRAHCSSRLDRADARFGVPRLTRGRRRRCCGSVCGSDTGLERGCRALRNGRHTARLRLTSDACRVDVVARPRYVGCRSLPSAVHSVNFTSPRAPAGSNAAARWAGTHAER